MSEVKECGRCHNGLLATAENFNASRATADGLQGYCIPCAAQYQKEHPRTRSNSQYAKSKRAEDARGFYARNRDRLSEEKAIAALLRRGGSAADVVAFIVRRIDQTIRKESTKYENRVVHLLGVTSINEARAHFDSIAAMRGMDSYRVVSLAQSAFGSVTVESVKRKTFNIYNMGVTR